MVEFQMVITRGENLRVFCTNYRACGVLNRLYPQYFRSGKILHVFREGEEGIFTVPIKARDKVLRILKRYNCLY